MTNNIRDFLSKRKSKKYATDFGTDMHLKMQRININNNNNEIVEKIRSNPGLFAFFCENSRAEVPIAGVINGKFVSRRIDRLVIDEQNKQIKFLDYKTDIDKNAFRDRYICQMKEYTSLLRGAYPDYEIAGYILWLNDFVLEKI